MQAAYARLALSAVDGRSWQPTSAALGCTNVLIVKERPQVYEPMTVARLGTLLTGADDSVRWRLVAEFLEEYRWEPVDSRAGLLEDERRRRVNDCIDPRGTVELLAAGAVQPLVTPAVEVAGGGALPPQPCHPSSVARVDAGADEVVERQRQRVAQCGEPGGVVVHEGTHVHPGGAGGGDVLERVVVGSGQEPGRLTA